MSTSILILLLILAAFVALLILQRLEFRSVFRRRAARRCEGTDSAAAHGRSSNPGHGRRGS
jgi:hypothetical protein